MAKKIDLILIGAGLANSILALFLRRKHPDLNILLIEKGHEIPKAKTWCFHKTDITDEQLEVLSPIVAKTWPGYVVRFPKLTRRIAKPYHAIQPEKLEAHLKALFGNNLIFEAQVKSLSPTKVELTDGRQFEADCVIDGRGFAKDAQENCGFQKFVGLHIELQNPHGLKIPMLMDAKVEQIDGYRFLYVLPWSQTELLIEDTRYSSSPVLSIPEYRKSIEAYLFQQGWVLKSEKKIENGILPIPLQPITEDLGPIPKIGTAGGFFHPVTGYSLPKAAQLADQISDLAKMTPDSVLHILRTEQESQSQNWNYLCFLNRMMFEAANPEDRYRIFERFYSLNENLIARFYSGNLLTKDKFRILLGAPPVPIMSALRCIRRPQL